MKKSKIIQSCFTPEEAERIKDIAKQERMYVSQLVAKIVLDYLEEDQNEYARNC